MWLVHNFWKSFSIFTKPVSWLKKFFYLRRLFNRKIIEPLSRFVQSFLGSDQVSLRECKRDSLSFSSVVWESIAYHSSDHEIQSHDEIVEVSQRRRHVPNQFQYCPNKTRNGYRVLLFMTAREIIHAGKGVTCILINIQVLALPRNVNARQEAEEIVLTSSAARFHLHVLFLRVCMKYIYERWR